MVTVIVLVAFVKDSVLYYSSGEDIQKKPRAVNEDGGHLKLVEMLWSL